MKKQHSLFSICLYLFLLNILTAQTPITPKWQTTHANKDHTSRDHLHFLKKDSEGNLLLVSSIERDFTFSDILVQKLNTEGQLLWEYAYSSDLELDFDEPVDALVDAQNNITVVGKTLALGAYNGQLYAFRLNSEGQLLKEYNFREIFGDADPDYRAYHGFVDKQNNIQITYFPDGEPHNHFFKIDTTGTIINHYTKPANYNDTPIFTYHNAGEDFMFLREVRNPRGYYLEQVNETITTKLPIGFTTEIQDIYFYLQSANTKYDETGLSIGVNPNPSRNSDFYFFKIGNNGDKTVSYHSSDSLMMGIENFVELADQFLLTGRYRLNYQTPWNTFLIQLNTNGQVLKTSYLENEHPEKVPSNIYKVGNTAYLQLDDLANGTDTIYEINPDLSLGLAIPINKPAHYLFYGNTFTQLDSSRLMAAGTILTPKFTGSDYLSEREIYVETFDLQNGTPDWSFIHSDTGTSYVLVHRLNVDSAGNSVLLYSENTGPEHIGGPYAPEQFYLRRVDKNGQVEWNKPIEGFLHTSYSEFNAYFDSQQHIYVLTRNIAGTYDLTKYAPNGQELASTSTTERPLYLFINQQDELFLPVDSFEQQKIIKFDTLLNRTDSVRLVGELWEIFQIENDSATYIYDFSFEWGGYEQEGDLRLLKDGTQQWINKINVSSRYNGYVSSDINAKTGDLYVNSDWGQVNRQIQKITLEGLVAQTRSFENGPNDIRNLSVSDKGYLLQTWEDRIEVYDDTLGLIFSKPLLGDTYRDFRLMGDYLFHFESGVVFIYNLEGETIAQLTHPHISTGLGEIFLDQNYQLYLNGTKGGHLPVGSGYAFGWRWTVGYLDKFDLQPHIPGLIVSTNSNLGQKKENLFHLFPNPTTDLIYLIGQELKTKNLQYAIHNAIGQIVQENPLPNLKHPISVAHFEAGVYYLTVREQGQIVQTIKWIKK